ncbi:uncharacterized protein BXIN_0940 [Babesia sp. Xinjiang]|uniref:uncharacterized protein n=1 Tax=Babesia sp. Xinjiang TaxID=462227 RepID=UPI000A261F7C|nr:uncharacterized protein BXIN_0940 [Babesia sp. Xinjiang]ORM42092.1 hypothetical protein BXIN_0940 [Babesia sp. Xinjiang]
MGTIRGDHFRFDTISIQREGVEPPQYTVFRVPVPLESELVMPGEEKDKQDVQTAEYTSTTPTMPSQQNAVTVRPPFRDFIQHNMAAVENKMGVRMSLNPQGGSFVLIASGGRAQEAINEMLNMCRTSKVYNYYLCFPVRGAEFHNGFGELKQQVKKCIGHNVAFERRPHVTLALLNLVTDEDVNAMVRALQATTLAVAPLSLDDDGKHKPYTIELSGVKSIRYKGKASKRSVFMTNATPNETLHDIATEFQDSVKRTINKIIAKSNEQIKVTKTKPGNKKDNIGKMTEKEAAAHGIFITHGGNIEVTYTDIALVDPKAIISDQELDAILAELHSKNNEFTDEQPSRKDNVGTAAKHNRRGNKQSDETQRSNAVQHPETQESDGDVEYKEEEDATQEDENIGDMYDYDPSVTHELHVTLLRNPNVERLEHLKFKAQGAISCVELRPRGDENCSFKAYTKTQLLSFVGNRYDGKPTDEHGVNHIKGSEQPDLPQHLVTDVGATEGNDHGTRFVFWI